MDFFYPSRPNIAALDNFSLKVNSGETIALVGPSGAGKSTIFQLLLRFFDPTSGKIMLDGKPIISLEREEFRKHISIVTQDPVIFGTSALENIRFGRPEATDEEVVKAAKAAAAHDFLELLPDGYESLLVNKVLCYQVDRTKIGNSESNIA